MRWNSSRTVSEAVRPIAATAAVAFRFISRRRCLARGPGPRGTVNLPAVPAPDLQVGAPNSAGTAVVVLLSYSLNQQSRGAADGRSHVK